MFLKNYTSSVPAAQTIANIERLLVNAGATGFQKIFTNKLCTALIFLIEFKPGQKVAIKVPGNVELCAEALWKEYLGNVVKPRKTKADFYDQAARTAWKLAQDDIAVQISLIQLRQKDFLQAFMSQVWDGHTTLYERIRDGGFKMLLPEKSGAV